MIADVLFRVRRRRCARTTELQPGGVGRLDVAREQPVEKYAGPDIVTRKIYPSCNRSSEVTHGTRRSEKNPIDYLSRTHGDVVVVVVDETVRIS